MERCKICNGKGKIIVKGKEVICKCRLLPYWETKLGQLARCGAVSKQVKKAVMDLIKEHPVDVLETKRKLGPRQYYFIDNDAKSTKPRKYWKGFMAYYLVKSLEFLDFKYVEFSMLNEAFFSDKSASASMSDEVRYFDLPNKTIVLAIMGKPSSRISEDILRTFLDTYKDRHLFIYFSKASQDGIRKPEWTGKGMENVTTVPGLHHVVKENMETYNFVNITERWGL